MLDWEGKVPKKGHCCLAMNAEQFAAVRNLWRNASNHEISPWFLCCQKHNVCNAGFSTKSCLNSSVILVRCITSDFKLSELAPSHPHCSTIAGQQSSATGRVRRLRASTTISMSPLRPWLPGFGPLGSRGLGWCQSVSLGGWPPSPMVRCARQPKTSTWIF